MKSKKVKINSKSGKNKIPESSIIKAEVVAKSVVETVEQIKPLIDSVTVGTKQQLRDSINKCIELANDVMSQDRSTVLRLKGVVGKLQDALKVIK